MRFSVVTPSLNQASYLPETLASVITATRAAGKNHEVEHIVVDGGSTDGTIEILRQQESARWISEPDQGQTDAVNKGWRMSSGDVLSFLCADDLLEPDTFSLVGDAFENNPQADVIYGDYFFLEGDSGWKRFKRAGPFSPERLRKRNFLSQPATFIRRRVFERFGPLDSSLRFCMDNEYWLRISGATRWVYLERPLAISRLHGGSKTSSQIAAAWWEAARMGQRYQLGPWPWIDAVKMQLWGQYFYRMKRAVFLWLGHRRRRPGSAA